MLSKEENNNHGEGVNCKSQNIMETQSRFSNYLLSNSVPSLRPEF